VIAVKVAPAVASPVQTVEPAVAKCELMMFFAVPLYSTLT
jgi:hypothetical protein